MPNKPMRLSNIHKYKKLLLIPIIVAAILILWFLIYQLVFNPYRGTTDKHVEPLPLEASLTEKQVLKDMDYTIKTIRSHHPAWLEKDNEKVQAVEEAYKNECRKLREDGTDSYTTLDEWRILSGIINKLHDGHTGVLYKSDSNCYIDDVTQVEKYGVPVEINGNPSDQLLKDFMGLFSYEGDEYARGIFRDIIQNEAYLKLLGVDTTDGVTFTFATEEGNKDYHYSMVPYEQVKGISQEKDEQWVDYEIDKDNSLAIFTLKECNYDDYYISTVNQFFKEVIENKVENIIVDLRNNGGGHSYVADEFLSYLDIDGYNTWACAIRYGAYLKKYDASYTKINKKPDAFSGNLYVLTDVNTYSAAMDFAMYVADNDLGTIVGEASGNMPDSYGDVLTFVTPNSKLSLRVSFKRWYRIDETKSGQPVEPDVPCEPQNALNLTKDLICN